MVKVILNYLSALAHTHTPRKCVSIAIHSVNVFFFIILLYFANAAFFCRYTFLSCHLDKQNKRDENEGKVVVAHTHTAHTASAKIMWNGKAEEMLLCWYILCQYTSNKYEYNLGIGTRNIFQSNDIFLCCTEKIHFFFPFASWSLEKLFAGVFLFHMICHSFHFQS